MKSFMINSAFHSDKLFLSKRDVRKIGEGEPVVIGALKIQVIESGVLNTPKGEINVIRDIYETPFGMRVLFDDDPQEENGEKRKG